MNLHVGNSLFWSRKGSVNGQPLAGGQQIKSTAVLAKGAALFFCRRPLVEAVLAANTDFFGAVGQQPRRLQKLLLAHKILPLQAPLHTDGLAKIAVDTKLRLVLKLFFAVLFSKGQRLGGTEMAAGAAKIAGLTAKLSERQGLVWVKRQLLFYI